MQIQITNIHEDPGNARKIAATEEQDLALRASLQTLGLLQPVLVEESVFEDGHWDLRAGHRRLAAAKALGWLSIEAVAIERTTEGSGERTAVAVSAAENMVRTPMHPVDQWRAVAELMQSKLYNLETAGAALGIPLALARRMQHLGSMAPELIEAIGEGDLPEARYLRIIALAPHDVQITALKRATKHTVRRGEFVDWYTLAELCTLKRVAQSRAIFDVSKLEWEEDLFAEPDAAERFTTRDIDGFMALQKAALEDIAAKSKGRIIICTEAGRTHPSGWQSTGDDMPKRWRKLDPRRAFATLLDQGYYIGEVRFDVCKPIANTRTSDARGGGLTEAEQKVKPRDPISKAVQTQLARMKTAATCDFLAAYAKQEANAGAMLELLLLSLCARNVSFGPMGGSPYGRLAERLVTPEGKVRELMDDDLCEIAADAIAQVIRFDAPDDMRASGAAAEWIATAIKAELPRTDTPEILKGVTGDLLAEIAQAHGVKPAKTVGELRKKLAGALPDWRAVSFGAPGPNPDDPEFAEVEPAPDSVLAAMNDDPDDLPDAVADAWTSDETGMEEDDAAA